MHINQLILKSPIGNDDALKSLAAHKPNLVTVFGAVSYFENNEFINRLRELFSSAVLIGCSSAGEISLSGVSDGQCIVTTVQFSSVSMTPVSTRLVNMEDSRAAGERVGAALNSPALKAVVVFAPGLHINGSDMVDGIASRIGSSVPITGGLAGDGGAFKRTFTLGLNGAHDDEIVAIGLTGETLQFAHGSFGGWEPFGPARKVTRSMGNILYELDGEPALSLYKRYLGNYATGLPASGLLFPFAMLGEDHRAVGLIRTILGIDEAAGSLTLAGSIDPAGYLMLMHASSHQLTHGAEAAAQAAQAMHDHAGESLAILVSCVGRKLVMGDSVDEEVEAVGDVFGRKATLAGFYSYGEISPFTPGSACHLHNQTMTITWIGEQ